MTHLLIVKNNRCYERDGVLNLVIIPNNEFEFNRYSYKSIDAFPCPNEIVFSCLLDNDNLYIPKRYRHSENPKYFFKTCILDYLKTIIDETNVNTAEISKRFNDFYPIYKNDKLGDRTLEMELGLDY